MTIATQSGTLRLVRIPAKHQQAPRPAGPALKSRREFLLTRYFSTTSAVGIIVILFVLLGFYRYLAINALMDHQTRDNVAVTQVFANTIWPAYASFVENASMIPRAELARLPETVRLRDDVLRLMSGLTVVKVKIYNRDGLTVFSSDPKQIGEDESANAGFLQARAGETASEITFRDRFDSFEREVADRNLVSSYIPIRTGPSTPVEGVAEVYSDVTDFVAELEKTQWQIAAGVLASLSLLYLFLFAIVRRAGGLIDAQRQELRLAHEAMLLHQARHDSLTGLPNQASFFERLDAMIKAADRTGTACAVLRLDLDGFKNINDSLGHVIGDRLLQEVGNRLKDCLSETDVTARFGGDEFMVALPGVKGIEHVTSVAEKIRRAIAHTTYALDGYNLAVTTSIGIALYPDDGSDKVELSKSADAATFHAKKMGRNNYQFHTADMNAKALALLQMEHGLRQALERGEFHVHYQPQLDLGTGKIVGAEALVRWQHPELGVISPAQFIPLAEERGLIAPIGEWMLREACRQNREWQKAGLPPLVVAVNLSALQFEQKDIPGMIARVLRSCGLAPEFLELELTESAIMRDAESTVNTMRTLKGIGVALSLDDFGTGYSSLSHLKRFPLDKLKIDQSFVRGLPHDPDDLAISTSIIGIGKALGLKVIAEGVETAAQLKVLQERGCDEIQGYYVTKPLAALEFAQFVRGINPQSTGPAGSFRLRRDRTFDAVPCSCPSP